MSTTDGGFLDANSSIQNTSGEAASHDVSQEGAGLLAILSSAAPSSTMERSRRNSEPHVGYDGDHQNGYKEHQQERTHQRGGSDEERRSYSERGQYVYEGCGRGVVEFNNQGSRANKKYLDRYAYEYGTTVYSAGGLAVPNTSTAATAADIHRSASRQSRASSSSNTARVIGAALLAETISRERDARLSVGPHGHSEEVHRGRGVSGERNSFSTPDAGDARESQNGATSRNGGRGLVMSILTSSNATRKIINSGSSTTSLFLTDRSAEENEAAETERARAIKSIVDDAIEQLALATASRSQGRGAGLGSPMRAYLEAQNKRKGAHSTVVSEGQQRRSSPPLLSSSRPPEEADKADKVYASLPKIPSNEGQGVGIGLVHAREDVGRAERRGGAEGSASRVTAGPPRLMGSINLSTEDERGTGIDSDGYGQGGASLDTEEEVHMTIAMNSSNTYTSASNRVGMGMYSMYGLPSSSSSSHHGRGVRRDTGTTAQGASEDDKKGGHYDKRSHAESHAGDHSRGRGRDADGGGGRLNNNDNSNNNNGGVGGSADSATRSPNSPFAPTLVGEEEGAGGAATTTGTGSEYSDGRGWDGKSRYSAVPHRHEAVGAAASPQAGLMMGGAYLFRAPPPMPPLASLGNLAHVSDALDKGASAQIGLRSGGQGVPKDAGRTNINTYTGSPPSTVEPASASPTNTTSNTTGTGTAANTSNTTGSDDIKQQTNAGAMRVTGSHLAVAPSYFAGYQSSNQYPYPMPYPEPPVTMFPHELADRQRLFATITTLSTQVQRLSIQLKLYEDCGSVLPVPEEVVATFDPIIAESHIARLQEQIAHLSMLREADKARTVQLEASLEQSSRTARVLSERVAYYEAQKATESHQLVAMQELQRRAEEWEAEVVRLRQAEARLTREVSALRQAALVDGVRIVDERKKPPLSSVREGRRRRSNEKKPSRHTSSSRRGRSESQDDDDNDESDTSDQEEEHHRIERVFLEMDEQAARQDVLLECLHEPLSMAMEAGIVWLQSVQAARGSGVVEATGTAWDQADHPSSSLDIHVGHLNQSGVNSNNQSYMHNASGNSGSSQLELDRLAARSDAEAMRHRVLFLESQVDRLERAVVRERQRADVGAEDHKLRLQQIAAERTRDRQIMLDAMLPEIEARLRQAFRDGQVSGALRAAEDAASASVSLSAGVSTRETLLLLASTSTSMPKKYRKTRSSSSSCSPLHRSRDKDTVVGVGVQRSSPDVAGVASSSSGSAYRRGIHRGSMIEGERGGGGGKHQEHFVSTPRKGTSASDAAVRTPPLAPPPQTRSSNEQRQYPSPSGSPEGPRSTLPHPLVAGSQEATGIGTSDVTAAILNANVRGKNLTFRDVNTTCTAATTPSSSFSITPTIAAGVGGPDSTHRSSSNAYVRAVAKEGSEARSGEGALVRSSSSSSSLRLPSSSPLTRFKTVGEVATSSQQHQTIGHTVR